MPFIHKPEDPNAYCRLTEYRGQWRWVVDECPHCNQRHEHGGGRIDEDPHKALSHRIAHCHSGGYNLRAIEKENE